MSIKDYEVQSHDRVAFVTAVAAMASVALWESGAIPFWVFMAIPSLTMFLAIRRFQSGGFDEEADP